MKFWTLAEIKDKIKKDLDLQSEVFIEDDELEGYINEGIDEAEAEIHTIYEDYFIKSGYISLTADGQYYDLPSDIYAQKIRKIIYSDGQSQTYEISRIPESDKFSDIALTERFRSTEFYRYLLVNETPGSPQIYLVPASRETSSDRARIWYLRNANRLEADTDVCDIPEFVHFVIAFAKLRCLEKEGHPGTVYWDNQMERQRRLMINTLTGMVVDGENKIEPEMMHYDEQS